MKTVKIGCDEMACHDDFADSRTGMYRDCLNLFHKRSGNILDLEAGIWQISRNRFRTRSFVGATVRDD